MRSTVQSSLLKETISCGLLGILSFVLSASAQPNPQAAIAGRVLDDSTSAPVSNVNVFVANTTLGCSTDERGLFEIRNIPFGTHEIVVSRIGYSLHSFRTSLTESRTRRFEIRLKPMSVQLEEVMVSAPDPVEWRKQLQKFNDLFLGNTQNAEHCKITNAEILDFKVDGLDVFEATARQPVEIENLALGYHVQMLLKTFKVENEVMILEGMPKFTELRPSTPAQEVEWRKNRMRAFRGSLRHFLISLFNRQLGHDGYSIFRLDFLRMDRVASSRKLVTEDEILSYGPGTGQKTLRFSGFLEVEYSGDVESGYNLLHKAGTTGQVSWLALNYFAITITERGSVNEGFPTKVFGYWSWKRMADALPLDFEPEKE